MWTGPANPIYIEEYSTVQEQTKDKQQQRSTTTKINKQQTKDQQQQRSTNNSFKNKADFSTVSE